MPTLDRRSFTAISGIAAFGGAFGVAIGIKPPTASAAKPQAAVANNRALLFAHFTDIHMTTEHNAAQGTARALATAQGEGISMILTGGDLVMDSFATKRATVDAEWALFHKTFDEHCKVPVEHCLGNHDVFGWCKAKSGLDGSEPDYGYARAMAETKLASRWRSFDRNGWHFIVLSSVEHDPKDECGYLAQINPEQRAWLEKDLAANTLPTVVVSHIPIVTITPSIRGESSVKNQQTIISGGLVHLDAADIHKMFRKSGRVKLVLSGHTHLVDRCTADGVTYACSGAICGGWWKKNATYCDPCYALIDLKTDGSFEYQLRPTGWTIA